ncbi:tryptophan synthase subunit alpha [Aneurinibacillus uraniidurans]|uniref:tryptophan synthase subunit alpha n=1 Tax=Aneurinibacillus uraniidurans TaxID=2966586 RepID=UPI00234AB4C5|nr:tryptophan synthase subunit alpha [Aneurinibacillus sp. B1]WCN39740.1 tryptophan synthase subunit alpha [Aneurinibacillus sp. B1]
MNLETGSGAARIAAAFNTEKPAFIPFMTAGYPAPEHTVDLALALQEEGAAILELGVPYSDPLADGPTIQNASAQALAHGVTMERALELARDMRTAGVHIPIILFTYINPVLRFGPERLYKAMEAAEVDGILIPDLPFEEAGEINALAKKYGRPLISLVAPTSAQRVKMIAEQAQGFVYCVSSLGVTGVRSELREDITDFLEAVRRYARVPVAVGFGISGPDQVAALAPHCDGVIVGSALLNTIRQAEVLLSQAETKQEGLTVVKKFVKLLQSGV